MAQEHNDKEQKSNPKRSTGRRARQVFFLYEDVKLVEKPCDKVSSAWQHGDLLLLTFAFVYGICYTYLIHLLIYMFEEKCILFPKFLTLPSFRNDSVIFGSIPLNSRKYAEIGRDAAYFRNHWYDKYICYVPNYFPLMSAVIALLLVLMVIISKSKLWRIVMLTSLMAMLIAAFAIHTAIIVHNGLNEVIYKFGSRYGSEIQVTKLKSVRVIRGADNVIVATILSVWMCSLCWLGFFLLGFARIVTAADFILIRTKAQLVTYTKEEDENFVYDAKKVKEILKDARNKLVTKRRKAEKDNEALQKANKSKSDPNFFKELSIIRSIPINKIIRSKHSNVTRSVDATNSIKSGKPSLYTLSEGLAKDENLAVVPIHENKEENNLERPPFSLIDERELNVQTLSQKDNISVIFEADTPHKASTVETQNTVTWGEQQTNMDKTEASNNWSHKTASPKRSSLKGSTANIAESSKIASSYNSPKQDKLVNSEQEGEQINIKEHSSDSATFKEKENTKDGAPPNFEEQTEYEELDYENQSNDSTKSHDAGHIKYHEKSNEKDSTKDNEKSDEKDPKKRSPNPD